MKAILFVSLVCSAAVSCTAPAPRTDTPVPEQAARLSVAKCSKPAPVAIAEYTQQLKARGPLKLYAKPELDGAMGAVEGDVLHARKVSDGVWAVLVADFDKQVCEAYVSEDDTEMVNNSPGPDSEPEPSTPDVGVDAGDADASAS